MPHRRIAFALDYPSLGEARAGAARVRGHVGIMKVGLELFAKEGPAAFTLAGECGAELFADLKLHDIPETVERAVASGATSGARFVTLHATGSPAMLARAVERALREANGHLRRLAVIVLRPLAVTDL